MAFSFGFDDPLVADPARRLNYAAGKRRETSMPLRLALCALFLALAFGPPSAAAAERCSGQLPAAVAAKRDAIAAAAQARDWEALKRQIGPGEFIYSFGDDSDAIAYWRQSVGEGIDIPDLIASVLAMRCAITRERGQTTYWWPSATEFDWKALTPAEKRALEALYGAKIDDWYMEGRAAGYYVGWRLSIEASGAWSAFVAGD